MSDPKRIRILFFIPEDWYLVSHRLPLLTAAIGMGYEVFVVTCVKDHAGPIIATGAELIPIRLRRGFQGLVHDITGLWELIGIYRRVRPDIVHHVTLKSVVYGSVAARLSRTPCSVNAIAGLGFAFTSRRLKARLAGPVLSLALRVLLKGPLVRLIVQNEDDRRFVNERLGVPLDMIELIRGAGVNVEVFHPPEADPPLPIRVVVVARMLLDKGIEETVEAVRILRGRGRSDIRIILAGRTDYENPERIMADRLNAWESEGLVEWKGHVADVPALLRTCHIALLPSYREGLPKALLECASCGLPIIATDVPGCREICHQDINGLLVPARAAAPIADAIVTLVDDPELRNRMGVESRRIVLEAFTEESVTGKTVGIYRHLLHEAGRD